MKNRRVATLTGLLAGAAILGLIPALTPLATLIVVPAMVAATFVGVRAWWPPAALPWRLLGLSAVVALVGAVVSAAFEDGSVPGELVPLPQYLAAGAALVAFDRARRVERDRSLFVDAGIVGVAAGLVAFALFVSPVLDRDLAPVAKTMRATYPALDVVLLFLVTRLGFGGAWRCRSFRLLVSGFAAALVGNLVWASYDAGLIGEPHGIDDVGYLIAFAAFGLAALDRSMAALAAPSETTLQPLRGLRMAGLAASMAVAPAVVVLATPETAVERSVYLAGALALVALVGWRLVTAVNQHVASEELLAYAATHDRLTDLPNRTQLSAEIADVLGRNLEGLAVIFLDVDRFKNVNERWGHGIGDELLVAVAERLRACVRGANVVGRVSGDEFLIVCPDLADAGAAEAMGQRVLESFRSPFGLSVGEVIVSVSVGVAFLEPRSYASAEQIIRDADTAMYRAKDGGRDRVVVFAEEMRPVVRRRHEMDQALRWAIERGEIRVHYQPIVDLVSGRVVGIEALLRWFADGKAVSPDEFIPVAEETGLIVPMGIQVLNEATAVLASCRRRHPELDLTMSVNLSARQLRDPGLAQAVQDAAQVAGIPPGALCVELTESAMLEGSAGVVDETLADLRAMGVGITADDFGTGYNSLPYLKRFRIGRLKIDIAFVHGLGVSPHDEAIVAGILAIARSLGLEVVAEGVETAEQADRLVALGCRLGQGWLYSTALPAHIAAVFIADRSQPSASRTALLASSTVMAASSGSDAPRLPTS